MLILKSLLVASLVIVILISLLGEFLYYKLSNETLLKWLDEMCHYSVGIAIILILIIVAIGY